MKRIVPVLIFLGLTAITHGDSLLSFGPGFQFSSQTYRISGQDDRLATNMLGLHVGGFFGGSLGFHSQLQLLFVPLDITLAGAALDPKAYTLTGLDIILGAGYRLRLTDWLGVIIGGGIHGAQVSVVPNSSGQDFGSDVAVGAGLLISLLFPLNDQNLISVDLQAAYDFLAIATDPKPDRSLHRGFSTGGAVAFGVVY